MDYFKEENVSVTQCYHSCPFFGTTDGSAMVCQHPKWESNLSVYAGLIITQENSRDGNFPSKCPLKEEGCTSVSSKYTYKIKLD